MRIIWLADFTLKTRPGGAQITNQTMIDYGRKKRKLEIVEVDFEEFKTFKFQKDDVAIINNIAKINQTSLKKLILTIKNIPYIRYLHDYDWVYNDMRDATIREVFDNAKGVVFLSPLHKDSVFDRKFIPKNFVIIPSPIDTKVYKNLGNPRIKNSVIYAGEINTHKGINHLYNYALFHPEKTIDIYGWIAHPELTNLPPKNVHFKDKQSSKKMVDVYNQYEETIHLPIWREPFGRSLAEAVLCGCKPITNGKTGFDSYKWTEQEMIEELNNSPKNFWDYVKETLL